jgi:uncharacterized protein YbaP (TraB family)
MNGTTTGHPLEAKGLLFKIQDTNQKTRGYLFGTGHTFQGIKFDDLHHKIIKYFNQCNELFVEINFRSREKFINHFSVMYVTQASIRLQMAKSTDEEFNSIIDKVIKQSRENPKGIDDVLINKAEELKKEIQDIDTLENMRILEEKAYYSDEFYWFMHDICDILINLKLNSDQLKEDLKNVYNILLQSFDALDSTNATQIKEYKYFLDQLEMLCAHTENFEIDVSSLKEHYFKLFANQNVKENNIDSWLKDKKSKAWLTGAGASEDWINGTVEQKINTHLKLDSPDFDRDPYMAEVIHENLQSHPEQINFFAVGCLHVINNQNNIRKILTDKGWSIIPQFDPTHSATSNIENLERVSRFFKADKNMRQNSLKETQYKPSNELIDPLLQSIYEKNYDLMRKTICQNPYLVNCSGSHPDKKLKEIGFSPLDMCVQNLNYRRNEIESVVKATIFLCMKGAQVDGIHASIKRPKRDLEKHIETPLFIAAENSLERRPEGLDCVKVLLCNGASLFEPQLLNPDFSLTEQEKNYIEERFESVKTRIKKARDDLFNENKNLLLAMQDSTSDFNVFTPQIMSHIFKRSLAPYRELM